MTDPTFPTDERSQTVPSFTVLRYKFSRVSDSFRERSRGKCFQNVFYLHHRYDRWNVSRSATGWKKRGDRFERCGNICGTRPTIIGTFPLTSRNGERGTHGAARRDNQRDFSDTPKPSAFFLFRLQTVFPPHYTYIYIYIFDAYLFLTFVCHDWNIFLKIFESLNLDR